MIKVLSGMSKHLLQELLTDVMQPCDHVVTYVCIYMYIAYDWCAKWQPACIAPTYTYGQQVQQHIVRPAIRQFSTCTSFHLLQLLFDTASRVIEQ